MQIILKLLKQPIYIKKVCNQDPLKAGEFEYLLTN